MKRSGARRNKMANVVQIVLNALDKTKQGFTAPIKNLKDLGAAVDKVKPAFLTLAATASAAFAVMARQAVNRADEMNLLAQKAGTTTEEFSALNYVSELADLQTQNLVKSYKELSKHLVQATDSASPAASMFRQMGIETRDANGQMLTADALMQNIADRFADTADGASKVAAATKIFGDRLGQEMIPFLNQGSAEIRKLREEALLFGQVVDSKTAKAADEFNDNLTKMKLILQGIVNQVVAEFLPTAARLTSEFVEWIKQTNAIDFATGVLVDTFKTFGYVIRLTLTSVQALSDIFTGLGKVAGSAAAAMVAAVEAGGGKAGAYAAMLEEKLKGNTANAEFMKENMGLAQAQIEVFKNSVESAGKDAADAWEKAMARLSKGPTVPIFGEHGAGTDDDPIGVSKPPMPSTFTGNSENTAKAYELEQQMILRTREMLFQANEEKMTFSQQQAERLAIEMDRERLAFDKRVEQIFGLKLETDKSHALIEKAAQEHAARMAAIHANLARSVRQNYGAMLDASASIFGSMASLAQSQGKKGFEMWKAFSYAQAVVSVAAGVARAFADHAWPLSIFVAGAVAAQGAAQIATIASAKPPQAHAGLGNVPEDATYYLKAGERVLAPEQNMDLTEFLANQNRGFSGPLTLVVNGKVLGEVIGDIARDGMIEIPARAIA